MTDYSTWRPHPWHGLAPGDSAPEILNAFIEITPFDSVKYEIDKVSGYLKVDRPQRTSSLPPTPYGFVPQTYAGDRVAALMPGAKQGDHDPLDICVFSERSITRGEVLLQARVVGGIPMLDRGEADDKIVGILLDDPVFGSIRDIEAIPSELVARLTHYFSTYKLGLTPRNDVEVGKPYGRERALAVVSASLADYREAFPG